MTLLTIFLQVAAGAGLGKMGAALGAGIAIVGAALGIGRIGSSALDAMARQPESTNDIRSNMILAAALIEGAAFFALLVCILVLVL
ncbi:MAG: ATP synthase F0 subunit C [Prevotellaceae bacterium]|jgi:F-type H+-transporting ATPase subunit c|nr:ATP synthase F0 subunit C [Prevotellaceae bacterium]